MEHQAVCSGLAIALFTSVGLAQSVAIDNGVIGDGHLLVQVDGYGAYTNWGWSANQDYYDPAGPLAEDSLAFISCFMLYSGGIEKVAIAEPFFDIDNTYNLRGGTFDLPTPSNPVVNPAGDSAKSAWSITNFVGNMSFDFELTQTVADEGNGVASLTQVLTITNTAAAAVGIDLQRHVDFDLPWDGIVEDVAGSVNCNGVIGPYMREPDGNRNSPTLASLTSPDPIDYVAGKSGFRGMTGGMSFAIWDNFGYPPGWRNYTAGVGVAPVVGELPGARPPGSAVPYDAFISVEWSLELDPGESQTITAITQYGIDCFEVGCPCACEFDTSTGPGVCDIFDFLAFQNAFAKGDPCACDYNTGQLTVCDIFDYLDFMNDFANGCK